MQRNVNRKVYNDWKSARATTSLACCEMLLCVCCNVGSRPDSVLSLVRQRRDAWPFRHPVDEEFAPNYRVVIQVCTSLFVVREQSASYRCKNGGWMTVIVFCVRGWGPGHYMLCAKSCYYVREGL